MTQAARRPTGRTGRLAPLLLAVGVAAGLQWGSAEAGRKPAPSTASLAGSIADSTPTTPDGPVLHVVLIELAPDTPAAQVDELIADAKRLLGAIPGVEDVRAGRKAAAGRDVHVKDYDVALCVRLSRLSDLAVYADDPRHLELLAKHKARVARLRVIDFFGE